MNRTFLIGLFVGNAYELKPYLRPSKVHNKGAFYIHHG